MAAFLALSLMVSANAASSDLARGRQAWLDGQRGEAVLAFKRGLAIDPRDPALRQALAFARSRIDYPADVPRPSLPNREPGAWLLLAGMSLGCVVRSLRGVPRWRWLAVGFGAVAWTGWSETAEQFRREVIDNDLVIVRAVPLRSGDGERFPPRLSGEALPAGVEVTPRSRRGDWWQVELPGGVVGWLPAHAVRRSFAASVVPRRGAFASERRPSGHAGPGSSLRGPA